MKDYSLKGFFAASISEGVASLFIPEENNLPWLVLIGLVAYFSYIGLRKKRDNQVTWDNEEIFSGFLVAFVALWLPGILLIFILPLFV